MSPGRLAPAKVNLFLHVGPPDSHGYHPIASLMTFADIGDRVAAEPAAALSLAVEGPFGAGLDGGDNLVLRAARALLAEAGRADAPVRLVLDKQLPVAAGLGGGSSDAGAALKLLNETLGCGLADARLEVIAAGLGADGAACLRARPVIAEGRGERLSAAPAWPPLPCVLVNPGAPCSTAAVYRAFDQGGAFWNGGLPDLSASATPGEAAAQLEPLRNDLQAAATAMEPAIGAVLEALAGAPEAMLSRMSGSGATCFALCADHRQAAALSERLARAQPRWWVRACTLG